MSRNTQLVETSRVKETVSKYEKRMAITGKWYAIDVQPVKGDNEYKRLVFSAL